MALVHSLWTAPMLNNERGQMSEKQIESVLWCNASSVAFAKRLGEQINLYADDYGRELLDFLPYDNVYTLEVSSDIPTDFWAAGKFSAYQKMQLGDVHIDGDVFLKTPALLNLIKKGLAENDLIVQCVENSWTYDNEFYKNCIHVITANNIQFAGIADYFTPAYNCGLIGFNNNKLKSKYVAHYYDSIQRIYNNADAMVMIRQNKTTWMDLLCEQQHLYSVAQGYKVCNLLGNTYDECNNNAKQLGYQHLLGPDKWLCIEQIKRQLYNIDKNIFSDVIKKLITLL